MGTDSVHMAAAEAEAGAKIPHHLDTTVWKKYTKGRLLGSGQFGDVYLGTDKETKDEVAIKILKKGRIHLSTAEKEIAVHSRAEDALQGEDAVSLDTRLIRLHEVFMNRQTRETALVMDLARGGDLFDRVANGAYSEPDACKLLVLMVETLIKLHSIGIAHRDLKLENILLRTKDDAFDFCIADLGGAKWFAPGARAFTSTETGTMGYTAPEAYKSNPRDTLSYDAYQVDVFSLGVILYILLSGYPPWELTMTPPHRRPKVIDFETEHAVSHVWKNVSAEAKDLVNQMLCPDPIRRIGIERILAHSWIPSNLVETICPSGGIAREASAVTAPAHDPSKGEEVIELWQNQRHRLSCGLWSPPYRRKTWTDETGNIAYHDQGSADAPTVIHLPADSHAGIVTNCCASAVVGTKHMALKTISQPSAWKYATSWTGFSWETQQSWRGFVRRRRFLAVVAPIDATQAADNTTIDGPTTADIEQLEMVDLNDEWTEINIAARPAADEPSTAVNNAVIEIDQVLQEPSTAASAVVEIDQIPQTAQPDGVANATDKAADPQNFSVLNCVGMTNAILNQDKPNAVHVETQDS